MKSWETIFWRNEIVCPPEPLGENSLSVCSEYETVKTVQVKKTDNSRLVDDNLMSKGAYLGGLSWTATKWVVFRTHTPNLKSLHRCLR